MTSHHHIGPKDEHRAILLSDSELQLRLQKVKNGMESAGIDTALVCSNANIYYLTGRVFSGYVLLSLAMDRPLLFVRRPVDITGEDVVAIHKPENIPAHMREAGIALSPKLGLELGRVPYSTALRLQKAMEATGLADAGAAIAAARAAKTPEEVELIRRSGVRHAAVYSRIPSLYSEGMSDIELQIEIEHLSRAEGCLGQFRIAGDEMEMHMGSVLTGDNADSPSPFDFAMGGAGQNPSLPVGADGSLIRPGTSVMVDMNGNFTGYMTDMTRCYAAGTLPANAMDAHRLSIDICREIERRAVPGTPAKDLYELALSMAENAGLAHCFMGHRQHAGFVGHGIGIEVNELPVISPRSRDILQAGNVIAVEPKFVIPGVGAVGIENTYLVKEEGDMECLTIAPEEIIQLD